MLTGPEQLEWLTALSNAFSPAEFRELLLHRLNDRVDNYGEENATARARIGQVIDAYSRRGWEARLIAAAIEARPGNGELVRLASQKGAAAAPPQVQVERLVKDTNSFLEIVPWLEKAGAVQVCVCRIEIDVERGGRLFGTGFLIGPDLVVTNYHVIECVVANEDGDTSYKGPRATADKVDCRFDYKVLSNGARNIGVAYGLSKRWRVALSPNNPPGQEAGLSHLDVAVLRLDKPAGSLPVGATTASGDSRGQIALPAVGIRHSFQPHTPLFMIQHPEGDPLKLALESDAIMSLRPDRSRVRYRTNSQPGSSGSPCFDENWNLVAVHHAGDPNYARAAEFNEGIPIDTVVDFLIGQGVRDQVGV